VNIFVYISLAMACVYGSVMLQIEYDDDDDDTNKEELLARRDQYA